MTKPALSRSDLFLVTSGELRRRASEIHDALTKFCAADVSMSSQIEAVVLAPGYSDLKPEVIDLAARLSVRL